MAQGEQQAGRALAAGLAILAGLYGAFSHLVELFGMGTMCPLNMPVKLR